jgi:hypothetical protein
MKPAIHVCSRLMEKVRSYERRYLVHEILSESCGLKCEFSGVIFVLLTSAKKFADRKKSMTGQNRSCDVLAGSNACQHFR